MYLVPDYLCPLTFLKVYELLLLAQDVHSFRMHAEEGIAGAS